ncbi:MAG: class I SAM-dependent methyltransferase [Actinomycetota bacterium]
MIKQTQKLPLVENGIVVGTGSNKYQMRNPIGQLLIKQFDHTLAALVKEINPKTILEVGCGEGHVTQILLDQTEATLQCTDISDAILKEAKEAVPSSRVSFANKSIYELKSEVDQAELVVCCEVLEHLENPLLGLEKLSTVAAPYCLLSVPREPIFRTLNFIRGAHFTQFGNSPGHVQHWSRRGFIKLVQTKFKLIKVVTPLPWTVILARIQ